MKTLQKNRNGFATITAIATIGLVAVALAGLSLRFASDARRTATEADESQLRQVLFAGSMQARNIKAQADRGVISVPVPIPDATVALHFDDHANTATIEARLRSMHAEQVIGR